MMSESTPTLKITSKVISSSNFAPFGQFIQANIHHKPFDETDAQLNLSNGTPRFYLMHLKYRPAVFDYIPRHQKCTQCLGSVNGKSWWIAVAAPEVDWNKLDIDPNELEPKLKNIIQAFRVPGNSFIKLSEGTWHAGPYLAVEKDDDYDDVLAEGMNFINLELSDTNENDFDTFSFKEKWSVKIEIE